MGGPSSQKDYTKAIALFGKRQPIANGVTSGLTGDDANYIAFAGGGAWNQNTKKITTRLFCGSLTDALQRQFLALTASLGKQRRQFRTCEFADF